MPNLRLFPALALAALVLGCQSAPPPPPLEATDEVIDNPGPAAAAQLRRTFRSGDGFVERLERLIELEGQALNLAEYEPLKLGALGSAILDLNYASLSGHHVLGRFYEHVGAAEAVDHHNAWAQVIKAAMTEQGTGEADSPYAAITPMEAQFYLHSEGLDPVGAIYKSNQATPLMLMVLGRPPEEGPLRPLHFALESLHRAAKEQFPSEALGEELSPLTLMGMLARQGDPAAQTALGALLAARNRIDDAAGWLQAGARTDNVIAHNILARIQAAKANQAQTAEDRQAALEEVLENYLRAIALGSSNAMYGLAVLYLDSLFGADNLASAIPLLRQAGELGNSDAMLYLAYLHYAGQHVQEDRDKARDYFVRSASLNNKAARLGYARYLMREGGDDEGDSRAVGWLEEVVVETASPEAMVMLGNLHARGVGTEQNFRAAYRWYRDAAKAAPDQADIVNEVAWTLTVSDLKRLRRERFANRIMTQLMQSDEQAKSRPEYLDTWAATYAATGNFSEAVRLQELALREAMNAEREDVLDVLRQHLDLFREGKPVIEQVP